MCADWSRQDELQVLEYDTARYRFREWFCNLFGASDLENLHSRFCVNPENYPLRVSDFQRKCDEAAAELKDTLDEFFVSVISAELGQIASRQPAPTFRSHFAVTDAALQIEARDFSTLGRAEFLKRHYFDNYRPGIFHRDKDYGLIEGTVNAWIPVTAVSGTNSLWIGGRKARGLDALPICLRYGQCLIFDGANRWHGTVWNTSNVTRISFDIRFLPACA